MSENENRGEWVLAREDIWHAYGGVKSSTPDTRYRGATTTCQIDVVAVCQSCGVHQSKAVDMDIDAHKADVITTKK